MLQEGKFQKSRGLFTDEIDKTLMVKWCC